MNTKNILISGVVGGVVDFLLGWLLYGIVFASYYPQGDSMNMAFIALGCLAFGFVIAYIYSELASISSLEAGLKTGVVLGVLFGFWMAFFSQSMNAEPNWALFGVEILISVIIAAGVGAVIGLILGKLNKE